MEKFSCCEIWIVSANNRQQIKIKNIYRFHSSFNFLTLKVPLRRFFGKNEAPLTSGSTFLLNIIRIRSRRGKIHCSLREKIVKWHKLLWFDEKILFQNLAHFVCIFFIHLKPWQNDVTAAPFLACFSQLPAAKNPPKTGQLWRH